MPAIRVYTSTGWQDIAIVGAQGAAGTVNPYQIGQTWGVGGALTAGMFVSQIFVPKRPNQAITVVGARGMINSGGSIGIQLQVNSINIGSVMNITTTAASHMLSQVLSNGDRLGIVLSDPTGSPADLSFTVLLEHSAT